MLITKDMMGIGRRIKMKFGERVILGVTNETVKLLYGNGNVIEVSIDFILTIANREGWTVVD